MSDNQKPSYAGPDQSGNSLFSFGGEGVLQDGQKVGFKATVEFKDGQGFLAFSLLRTLLADRFGEIARELFANGDLSTVAEVLKMEAGDGQDE